MVLGFLFSFVLAISGQAEVKSLSISDIESLKPLGSMTAAHKLSPKDKILYFWATWCPDCKEKLTSVFKRSALFDKYDIYLIATDKDHEKIQHYQKKNSVEDRVFLDEERALQKKLGVFSVPTIVRLKTSGTGLVITAQQAGGNIDPILKEISP